MSARRILAMTRKEALHIVRDPRSLAIALAVPLLMLLLFGYALTLDVDQVPALIYDSDNSPLSRDLIARFQGSRFFDVVGFTDNYAAIEREIDFDRAMLGVVIPAGYARKLLGDQHVDVQVLVDGSDSNTASIALGYVAGLMGAYNAKLQLAAQDRLTGREIKPAAEARLRVLYNSQLESKNYIVPGLIAVILMIIASLLTSLTIAREWEMGTMEQVLSTPLRPAEIALGKMLAYFGVGVIDTIISIAVGVGLFRVPLRGSVLLLAVSCGVFLIGSLFWGILISATMRSQLLAYQAGMISSFLPAFLLSGFVYAIQNMPPPIQAFTYIVPARYFIVILKGIFLKGVGFRVLYGELAFLSLFSVVVFLAAARKLRQKVA